MTNIEEYLSNKKYPGINSANDSNYYKSNCNFSDLNINKVIKFHIEEKRIIFEYNKTLSKTLYKLESENTVISNCIFKSDVYIESLYQSVTFINCKFDKKLFINMKQINLSDYQKNSNIKLEEPSEVRLAIDKCTIEHLSMNNAIIKSKFYINKQDDENNKQSKIIKLEIINTKFEENFKLHNCEIDEVTIKDTDFRKNADFFMSIFKKGTLVESKKENISKNDIGFKAINFESLALFGNTEFHKKLIFKYVTFKGHNHFKSAKLHKGLDLEYTNIQNEINFYGLDILDTSTTSQETYRIIKHQFEKLGNKIDANKYHALELEQKKRKLNFLKTPLDYVVFKVHWISSEHSTNWFLPVLWMISLGIIFASCKKEGMSYLLFITLFPLLIWTLDGFVKTITNGRLKRYKNTFVSSLVLLINISLANSFGISFEDVIKNISLVNFDNPNSIMFFNKIIMGYLYYQFLMSVRKDTRK